MTTLLEQLRRDGFALTPNHDRPLTGRIVGKRFDPDTCEERDVTDFEEAGRVLLRRWGARDQIEHSEAERLGRRVRPVWHFQCEGREFRCNDAFEEWWHHGLQHASACEACGDVRWNNADRPAAPLCARCRRSATPQCPELELACSTAYKRYGCRCDECRAWNRTKHRRLRARRRAHHDRNPSVSTLLQKEGNRGSCSTVESLSSTNEGVTRAGPWLRGERDALPCDDWTWLPARLRASLRRYQAARDRELETLSEEEVA